MSDLTARLPLLVAAASKASGSLSVQCPYDQSQVGEVATGNLSHAEAALNTAHRLFRDRKGWLPLHRRVEIFEKLVQLMTEQQDQLAMLAASEGGKPLTDSQVEVARAIDGIKLCAEHIRSDHGHVIPMRNAPASAQHLAFTSREPIGVVVAVSAFNHPLNLIVHQVGAAVAAGCPVIVKPAEDTPLSCMRFVQLLHEAGLPEPWCQAIVPDDLKVATALVTDQRVGFFSFIGSARVGWMLRKQLADGTRCALEHGGVAPVLLAADADVEMAVAKIAKGGFYHAGQVCVSVQRVFAEGEELAQHFGNELAKAASAMKIGDPRLASTEIGPLIRHAEVNRVAEWVAEAVRNKQTELLCGGQKLSDSCYASSVLYNPPADAKVSTHEIFGPAVCVYPVSDLQEAAERANSLPFAFQASVFTSSLDTALRAYRDLDASAVMVNQHTAFRVDNMPFAGLRQSGLGVGGIGHTIDDMQIEKMMVVSSPAIL